MDEDAYDELVDEATHAVFNMLPSEQLEQMGEDMREGMMVQINDYLAEALSPLKKDDDPQRHCDHEWIAAEGVDTGTDADAIMCAKCGYLTVEP